MLLPRNVIDAFGAGAYALSAALILLAEEDEVWARYAVHPGELSVEQVREFFGCVVH